MASVEAQRAADVMSCCRRGDAGPAGGAVVVEDANGRIEANAEAGGAQLDPEFDVLEVEEIALVEAPDRVEAGPANKQKRGDRPLHVYRDRLANGTARLTGEAPQEEVERRRDPAGRVLQLATGKDK